MSEDTKPLEARISEWSAPVRPTGEQRLNGAYQQVDLDKQFSTQEEQAEVGNKMGWFNAVRDNEFWTGDVARSADTGIRNLWANIVGLPSDMMGLLSSIPLASPGTLPPNVVIGTQNLTAGVDASKFQEEMLTAFPFNSEELATQFGGDPTHPTMLATGIVAPGPGEFAGYGKAMVVGAVAARRADNLGRLDEFLKMDSNDLPAYNEGLWKKTGWYKGDDGNPRFFLSDADSTIKPKAVAAHPEVRAAKDRAAKSGRDEFTSVTYRLDEVMQHDELFQIYPELAGMQVTSAIKVGPDGNAMFRNPLVSGGNKGGMASNQTIVSGIQTANLSGFQDLHSTLLHEVQHTVQMIEGFAQGGAAKLTPEMIARFDGVTKLDNVLGLIDEGITTPDDLFLRLLDEGYDGPIAELMVEDQLVQVYLAADDIAKGEIRWTAEAARTASENEMSFVLEFLENGGEKFSEDSLRMLDQLDEAVLESDIRELGFRAYQNLHGEAEARLTERLATMTRAQIASRRAPPNPSDLANVDRPLSTGGQRTQAGQVMVRQTRASTDPLRSAVEGGPDSPLALNQGEVTSLPEGTHRIGTVSELGRPRQQKLLNTIAEIEEGFQEGTDGLFAKARAIMDDPELRPLMSTDKIEEIEKVLGDGALPKARAEYLQELIGDVEDELRELLEKDPSIANINIDDYIEGIIPLPKAGT